LIFDLDRTLTQAEIDAVIADDDAFFATKAFLNDFENLAAAISTGITDSVLAYAVHSTRLLRAHRLFGLFIEAVRRKHGDGAIYIEMEKVALEWQRRQPVEGRKHAKRITRLQAKLAKGRNRQG
jgi:hypothetical protein